MVYEVPLGMLEVMADEVFGLVFLAFTESALRKIYVLFFLT